MRDDPLQCETAAIAATDGTISTTNGTLSVVVSAATASRLGMTTSPGGTLTGGTAFGTQPVVAVLDQYGNRVTGSFGVSRAGNHGWDSDKRRPWDAERTTSVSASSGVRRLAGCRSTRLAPATSNRDQFGPYIDEYGGV